MADTKISALGAASALGGSEALPAVQAGGNVRITPAQLLTYVLGAAATTEAVQDIVGALVTAGTGITITYDDASNVEGIALATPVAVANGGTGAATAATARANLNVAQAGTGSTNPTSATDSTQGYGQGSLYIQTTSGLAWVCRDATAGAAVWIRLGGSKGTADPGVTTDASGGYAVGSTFENTATGIVWICQDATIGAAVWTQAGINDHPGYVSGSWYTPPHSARVGFGVIADTLYACMIRVKARVTLSGLGIQVVTAATGNVRLGIYTSAAGRPGAKVAEAATPPSTGTAAFVSAAFASNVVLNPGVYWLGAIFNAAPAVMAISSTELTLTEYIGGSTGLQAINSAGGAITGVAVTGATYAGGLPASFGAATVRSNLGTPLLAINIA